MKLDPYEGHPNALLGPWLAMKHGENHRKEAAGAMLRSLVQDLEAHGEGAVVVVLTPKDWEAIKMAEALAFDVNEAQRNQGRGTVMGVPVVRSRAQASCILRADLSVHVLMWPQP